MEPGTYFNPFLLEPVKDSPYINHELVKDYIKIGGVRLEVGLSEENLEAGMINAKGMLTRTVRHTGRCHCDQNRLQEFDHGA